MTLAFKILFRSPTALCKSIYSSKTRVPAPSLFSTMPTKKVTKKQGTKKAPTKTPHSTIQSKISAQTQPEANQQPSKPTPNKPPQFPTDAKNNNVRYWLIKSEPYSRIDPQTKKDAMFPFSELLNVQTEEWNGVRNHEAKNNMLNMSKGDLLLFYHSNAPVPGIVGIAMVDNEAHPDSLQFDSTSSYYDPKSTRENPRWWCVDVKFHRRLRSKISLVELRDNPKLQEMSLVKRGRLSVAPVRAEEYYEILEMEKSKPITNDIDCQIDEKFIDA